MFNLRALLALSLFAVALLFPSAVYAQRATLADGLKAAVLRIDETRVYAMLSADTGALDDLITADCLYGHSNGVVQTKAEFIHAVKTGAMKYASIRYVAPPVVRLFGTTTAILTGTAQLEVQNAEGRTARPTVHLTAVYVVLNDRWQLAAYQSTNAAAR